MVKANFENGKDRRVFERFAAKLPARFFNLRHNRESTGYTQDVSAKGLGLVVQEELTPYTPLELWLDIPDKGDPLYTRGEVVWSSRMNSGSWRVGVNLDQADLMGMARILRVA